MSEAYFILLSLSMGMATKEIKNARIDGRAATNVTSNVYG